MATQATSSTQTLPSGKAMNIVLWIIQGLLTAVFLFAGGVKFAIPIAQMTKGTGLPGWFLHFVGVCEILGALGLILPGITRIRTGLTPLAASGLVIIMIGATWVSIAEMGVKAGVTPCVVGLFAAFVAYARWKVAPLR
jgi:DoxX-like family